MRKKTIVVMMGAVMLAGCGSKQIIPDSGTASHSRDIMSHELSWKDGWMLPLYALGGLIGGPVALIGTTIEAVRYERPSVMVQQDGLHVKDCSGMGEKVVQVDQFKDIIPEGAEKGYVRLYKGMANALCDRLKGASPAPTPSSTSVASPS